MFAFLMNSRSIEIDIEVNVFNTLKFLVLWGLYTPLAIRLISKMTSVAASLKLASSGYIKWSARGKGVDMWLHLTDSFDFKSSVLAFAIAALHILSGLLSEFGVDSTAINQPVHVNTTLSDEFTTTSTRCHGNRTDTAWILLNGTMDLSLCMKGREDQYKLTLTKQVNQMLTSQHVRINQGDFEFGEVRSGNSLVTDYYCTEEHGMTHIFKTIYKVGERAERARTSKGLLNTHNKLQSFEAIVTEQFKCERNQWINTHVRDRRDQTHRTVVATALSRTNLLLKSHNLTCVAGIRVTDLLCAELLQDALYIHYGHVEKIEQAEGWRSIGMSEEVNVSMVQFIEIFGFKPDKVDVALAMLVSLDAVPPLKVKWGLEMRFENFAKTLMILSHFLAGGRAATRMNTQEAMFVPMLGRTLLTPYFFLSIGTLALVLIMATTLTVVNWVFRRWKYGRAGARQVAMLESFGTDIGAMQSAAKKNYRLSGCTDTNECPHHYILSSQGEGLYHVGVTGTPQSFDHGEIN